MNPVLVRQAVLADLEPLARLFDQYRQFQGKAPDLAACRAFLHDRFDHAESVAFLAAKDGQPLGFAQLYPSFYRARGWTRDDEFFMVHRFRGRA